MFYNITAIFLGFPIYEIVIGSYYNKSISCNTSIIISISNWLIIKGTVTILVMVALSISLFAKKDSFCNCISIIIFYISNIFAFSWLIIRTIIFWRDCASLLPEIVNTTMWASLIFGYVSVFSSVNLLNNDQISKNRKSL